MVGGEFQLWAVSRPAQASGRSGQETAPQQGQEFPAQETQSVRSVRSHAKHGNGLVLDGLVLDGLGE